MKTIARNKEAFYNYQIIEKFEAGISLKGQEVKSIRTGKFSFKGSYVFVRNNEVFLVNCNIPAYQPANSSPDYNPYRERKLLLNKKEIKYLIGKTQEKGLTLVPLSVYTKKSKLKLEIALVKGKRKIDKREDIRKKDTEREIRRTLKEEF